MASSRRMRLFVVLTIAASSLLLGSPGLANDPDEYPVDLYTRWKPTFGRVHTFDDPDSDDPGDHSVINRFGWPVWISRTRLDAPRTPPARGVYEHELRFKPAGSTGQADPWCEGGGIGFDRGTDWSGHVPPGTYHDWATFAGEGSGSEFTWGIPGWKVRIEDVYEINFDCSTSEESPTLDYNLTGQIVHCLRTRKDPCSASTTFADETVRHIPQKLGLAPENRRWTGSFPGSMPSFDGPSSNQFGEWKVQNGLLTQVCDPDRALHGECFARVEATDPQKRPILYFDYDPPGTELGTAAVYSEFTVRCPTTNQLDCPARTRILGLDGAGQEIPGNRTDVGPYKVPRSGSNQWYFSRVPEGGEWRSYEPGTRIWRFQLVIGTGRTLLIDYHQQSYSKPF